MLICKRCSCPPDIYSKLLSVEDSASLEKVFSALSSSIRLTILQLLSIQPHCVCDLEVHTGISQSLVSQYLTILENAELVEKARDGKFTEYSLTSKGEKVMNAIQLIIHSK